MCVEKKFAQEYASGEEALKFIKPGNAFACNRMGIFDHYGIFVGWVDGTAWIIHFSGEVFSDTCIRFDKFLDVTGKSKVRVFGCNDGKNPLHGVFHKIPCDPQRILRRALKKLGQGDYNVALWNCESYVNWVFYKIGLSSQAFKASPGAVVVAGVAIANPVQVVVAGAVAKTFLDAKFRSNTSKFREKQEELKTKVQQVIASVGVDGLVNKMNATNNYLTVSTNLSKIKSKSYESMLNKVLKLSPR